MPPSEIIVDQGDLKSCFATSVDGQIVERRYLFAPLPDDQSTNSLTFVPIDDPVAVQITGTTAPSGIITSKVGESLKYNRSMIIVLGLSTPVLNPTAGYAFYRIWDPTGRDPMAAGSTWYPWNNGQGIDVDSSPSPMRDTLLKIGTLKATSPSAGQVVITGTSLGDAQPTWTGTFSSAAAAGGQGSMQWV